MRSKFHNTTALVAAFSLSMPAIAPAQQIVEACEAGSFAVTADAAADLGLTLSDDQNAALTGAPSSGDLILVNVNDTPALCMTAADLEAMGTTPEDVAAAMAAGAMPADVTPEAEAQEATADAQAAEPAEAETAAAAEQPTETEQAAEAATAEAEATAEPEATVEAEAEATAEPETAAPETVEAAPEAEAAPESEQVAEQPAEAEQRAQAEETAAAEQPAEQGDAAPLEEKIQEQIAAVTEAIEQQSAEEADPEQQAQVAEAEAPTETAAAASEDAAVTEVEEQVVTEADTRSSSEEFQTKMQTTANATAASKDGGGLSNLEKALLVGLGAVVVGKALSNNSDAQVVSKSDDRVVLLEDGRYRVIRDDNELIERPGSTVKRESFADGSTRTTVTRENGVQIVTIRDAELRVLRRVRIDPDGTRTVLIDDTAAAEPVDVTKLPEPVEFETVNAESDADALRRALEQANQADRRFALYQVRNIERVRKLAPAIQLDAINFRTGSAVIDPQEAEELADLGHLIADYIDRNPGEVFLIEGHTDAVGNAAMNLALSDRRAESVALALTEYFDVPPENLVVQGYGESDLKVKTLEAERANRRAAVRRITPLITASR